jgi:hypothetical protein
MSTNNPPPISQEGISSVRQPQEPLVKPTPQQKEKAEKNKFCLIQAFIIQLLDTRQI